MKYNYGDYVLIKEKSKNKKKEKKNFISIKVLKLLKYNKYF